MRIIEYNDKYRDDMIFMVLQAKDALGRIPRLNSDLLDVQANYFLNGTCFWLAVDDNDRVIGCLGFEKMNNTTAKLHRFYVKASMKRQGIGSALLEVAESYITQSGYMEIQTHPGDETSEATKAFYLNKGYVEFQPGWSRKVLVKL